MLRLGPKPTLAIVVLLGWLACATGPAASDAAFDAWVQDLRKEALSRGISARTFDTAFAGVEPLAEVIELDRRQPEFTQTIWSYLDRRVTPERVQQGRDLLAQYEPLLRRIQQRYGVQPRFIVAFWGLETNFGGYVGDTSVVAALATLAYDSRRSAFFRSQLLDALAILDVGHIPVDRMVGSWAGAMGQLQFMPETFRRYAVDFDSDGRMDIWESLPDAFASAANYLHELGWDPTKTWGREVQLPRDFDYELASLNEVKPISDWRRLGVLTAAGDELPAADITASLVLPGGHLGPAFLVYQNFRVIMHWNASVNYALSVGYLADRIGGDPPLRAQRLTADRPLSRAEVMELQDLLNRAGFDTGKPDGMVGRLTRAALSAYQDQAGLPADGYPTIEVIDFLRRQVDDGGMKTQ
jgi:membrane-bound lytic murein transglycosylase B